MTDTRTPAEALIVEALETVHIVGYHDMASFMSAEEVAAAVVQTPAGRRLTTTDDPRYVAGLALERFLDAVGHPFGTFVIDTYGENAIRVWAEKRDGPTIEGTGMTVDEAIAAALGGPDDD